jgi:hypothetical protein
LNSKKEIEVIKENCNFVGRVNEDSTKFGERFWLEAIRNGYQKANIKICLGDGAKYNWQIQEDYFPDAIPILDYYHASEHLANAIKIVKGENTKMFYKTYEKLKKSLYVGDWKTIQEWTLKKSNNIKNRKEKKQLLREGKYFYTNRKRIYYADYEELSLPIGSGVIEAGIKQIVNKRIKGTEKHWIKNNADNILKLRIEEVAGNMHKLCQLEKLAA